MVDSTVWSEDINVSFKRFRYGLIENYIKKLKTTEYKLNKTQIKYIFLKG